MFLGSVHNIHELAAVQVTFRIDASYHDFMRSILTLRERSVCVSPDVLPSHTPWSGPRY